MSDKENAESARTSGNTPTTPLGSAETSGKPGTEARQNFQFDKSVLVPDFEKLLDRLEAALGQAWVADCQMGTSDKRLKAVWANVEEKRSDLLAALRLIPSARNDILEEAARECDKLNKPGRYWPERLAKNIRALKQTSYVK